MTIKEAVRVCLPRLSDDEVEAAGNRVWKRIEAELEKRKDQLAFRSLYGDGWSVPAVDEDDFLILSAVKLLGGQGDAKDILRAVQKRIGRTLLVVTGLNRLEAKGFVTSSGTGDRYHQRFQLTQKGEGALIRAQAEGKLFASPGEDLAAANERKESIEGGLPDRLP